MCKTGAVHQAWILAFLVTHTFTVPQRIALAYFPLRPSSYGWNFVLITPGFVHCWGSVVHNVVNTSKSEEEGPLILYLTTELNLYCNLYRNSIYIFVHFILLAMLIDPCVCVSYSELHLLYIKCLYNCTVFSCHDRGVNNEHHGPMSGDL